MATMKTTALVLVPVLAAAGCRDASSPSRRAATATVVQSSVTLGDPHIVSDSVNRLSILLSVYEPLVAIDDTGAFQPSLAERWAVSEDARTWTFTLRKGVTFHNGDSLRAGDVVASVKRALDPAIGGAFGTQGVLATYLGTAEVRALDESTVRIMTSEPMADLLDVIAAVLIGPERELARLPSAHVGTGPYRITAQTEDRVVLAAHDRYWGPAPAYQEIRFVAEPDADRRVDALLKAEADVAAGISIEGKARLAAKGGAMVHERESGLCVIFMLNAQNGPCRDRRVRQALNYAIVRDDAPWVFLYRPTNYWGVRSTMAGWRPRADGLLLLR
jgi:peptide/nickel transport system substrate-binding protein